MHKILLPLLRLFAGNKKSLSDSELFRLFHGSGNSEYLGELYSRYMHLVYGVCLKYLRNREEAKDAVMQIFEKLLLKTPGYEIRNFKSWLYVISKNHCLMEIRLRNSMDKKIKLWENDQDNFMEFTEELHPLDEELIENNQALNKCIEKLKKEQMICVRMFYFDSKSYREISNMTEMDEKKVKSLLQNAKRNLKICLENKHV